MSDGTIEREAAQLAAQQQATDRAKLKRAAELLAQFLSGEEHEDIEVIKQAMRDTRAFLRTVKP